MIEKNNTLNEDEEILIINNNLNLVLPVVYINNFNNNVSSDFLYHLSKQNISKKFSYVIKNNEFNFDHYFFNLDKNNPVIEFYIANSPEEMTFINFNRFISVGDEIKNFIYKNFVEKYNIYTPLLFNNSLQNSGNIIYNNFYANYEYDLLLENLKNMKIEISGNFLCYNLIIIIILFIIL